MNKFLFLLVALLCAISAPLQAILVDPSGLGTCNDKKCVVTLHDCCACKATSKTMFSPRQQFEVGSPELESLFTDRTRAREDGREGAFEAVLFGGSSTNRANLAAYFLPGCNTQLVVKSFSIADNATDIIAEELNIVTTTSTFSSVISFAPRQTTVGLGLAYRQAFAHCNDHEVWFEISAPIMRIQNTMGLFEQVFNDGEGIVIEPNAQAAGIVANATQAFSQPAWCCGKIDCAFETPRTRLGDISLQLGYEYLSCDRYYAESYVGALIPTGNRVTGSHVFEPIVGHNHHAGVMFGSRSGLEIWDCPDNGSSLWVDLHIHNMYLFRACERRLMDLKGKPWSRYMQVYKNQAQAELAFTEGDPYLYTPGNNVFCQPVWVTPGFQSTITTAFIYENCHFMAEGGYNFFLRAAECVQLKRGFKSDEQPALKALASAGLGGGGDTNDVLTISGGFVNEPVSIGALNRGVAAYLLNVITNNDLDVKSAEHPSMIVNEVYGSLGYRWDDMEFPVFVGIGGSYELSADNVGLNRWTAWVKGGMSF